MSVTLRGYSERGMINALSDDLCRAPDPALADGDFLSWFRFPAQQTAPVFSGISDATLLVEQSFSDFDDLDLLVLIDRNGGKEAAVIEAKVATDKATPVTIWNQWNRFHRFIGGEKKYRSSLFVQLFRKLRLVERVRDLDAPLPQHPIWGRQSLGANRVVLRAADLLAQYAGVP